MRKDHPGAYKWKASTSKDAQEWISSSNSLDTVYEVTLGKNKDNYLCHIWLSIFASRLALNRYDYYVFAKMQLQNLLHLAYMERDLL